MKIRTLFIVIVIAEIVSYQIEDLIQMGIRKAHKSYQKKQAEKKIQTKAGFKTADQVEAKLDRIGF